MEKQILDANVLVRFLRDDHAEHSPRARALITRAEAGEVRLVLLDAVVAEVVFVLTSAYGCTRRETSEALLPFLHHGGIECPEAEVIADALRHFSTKKVDYMDCFLAAAAKSRGIPVASFDRDFRKFDDIEWREPGD
ncbi:MAG: PIN domain-containing protein [Oceanipulchritudo sp.]